MAQGSVSNAPWANSSRVVSSQREPHPRLSKIISRYREREFQRPIAEHSAEALSAPISHLKTNTGKRLILDLGCGVGESCGHLARQFPDAIILGVDKSAIRVAKSDEQSLPSNAFVCRADSIDTVLLLEREGLVPAGVFLLYPNPWPKRSQLQRRWHGHPVFSILLTWGCYVELRTNWQVYAQEFAEAIALYGYLKPEVEVFTPQTPETPFERKYQASNHCLFKVRHGAAINSW